MFLVGVTLTIGVANAFNFFFQIRKIKAAGCIPGACTDRAQGSALFFFGILIVLFGWPVTGMAIECAGIFFLFRHVAATKHIPYVLQRVPSHRDHNAPHDAGGRLYFQRAVRQQGVGCGHVLRNAVTRGAVG